MKKYEIGFILKPNLDEATTTATIDQLKKIYTDAGSNIVDELNLGIRELAYEIEFNKTGYYFFFVAEATHATNQEFERICRINESIIRFIVLDVDGVEGSTLDVLR